MYVARYHWWLAAVGAAAGVLLSALLVRAGEAEDQFSLAAGHYTRGRYDAAVAEFRAFLKTHDMHAQSANARFFLGESLLQTGAQREATAEFTLLLERDAQNRYARQARFRLGEIAHLQGDHKAASEKLGAFLADHGDDPLAAYALVYRGQAQFKLNEAKEAEQSFQTALAKFPQGPLATECRMGLGQCAETRKDWEEAERFYGFVARSKEKLASEAQLRLGLLYVNSQEWAKAAEMLRPLAESATTTPQRGAARLGWGRTLRGQENIDQAIEVWQRALAEEEDQTTKAAVLLELATAHLEQGDAAKTLELTETFVEKHPSDPLFPQIQARRAQAMMQLAQLEQDDDQPVKNDGKPADDPVAAAALARARTLEKQGKTDDALAAYLDLIAKHKDSPSLPAALLAAARLHDTSEQDREADLLLAQLVDGHADYEQLDAALYQWAWVLLDLKRQDEATEKFTQLHKEHRASRYWADATYRLAQHKLRGKAYEETAAALAELVAAKPEKELLGHALLLQGQAATLQQKWDDVRAPLERFVGEYPQHPSLLLAEYWLAEADYRTAKYAEAGARLAKLSTKLEGRREPWLPMILLRLAQVEAQHKHWQEAQDLAESIGKQYPEFEQLYETDYLLGRSLAAQAKFNDARAAYERVLRSAKGGKTETAAMAQWMIGETYFQQERHDEAIVAYERVERLFAYAEWQAAALLQAGKCHEALGKWQEALGLYERLLKEHAKSAVAAEATQRVSVVQQRAEKQPPLRLPAEAAKAIK